MPTQPPNVVQATEKSIKAATHLSAMDAGAVATLRALARQVQYLDENGGLREDGKLDNVSIPTYLRFCESLGLTPAGRAKLAEKKGKTEDDTADTIAELRSIHGGRR